MIKPSVNLETHKPEVLCQRIQIIEKFINRKEDSMANITKERYTFRTLHQGRLSISEWYKRLAKQASACEFRDADEHIKDQIIEKTTNSKLREHALRTNLSLQAILKLAEHIENRSVHDCKNCGFADHDLDKSNCPAKFKVCNICKKMGHYAICCSESKKSQKRPGILDSIDHESKVLKFEQLTRCIQQLNERKRIELSRDNENDYLRLRLKKIEEAFKSFEAKRLSPAETPRVYERFL